MNIKKLMIVLLTTTPMSAMASSITGPYVDLGAGYNLTQIQHAGLSPTGFADGTGSSSAGSARFRHGNGFNGFASVGYGLGNGFRAEVEGVYFQSIFNKVNNTASIGKTGGVDQNYGALVNVIYDVDLSKFGLDSPITPYVGVGAGYLWSGLNGVNTQYVSGQNTRYSGTRGSFAYQGIVGASYDIPEVPGLALTADYRMIGQSFGSAYNSGTSGVGGFHSGHVNFDDRFNHQFNVGLRYAFNTAPETPQTVPATVYIPPAPAPERTYLVFFDWDSSELGQRAKDIISHAAGTSTHVSLTKIDVNGYTDNSSIHGGERGAKYNEKLSITRAEAVKSELIHDGVSENVISIHGYGESEPLVPTGPDTREPQNRRVEIIIH